MAEHKLTVQDEDTLIINGVAFSGAFFTFFDHENISRLFQFVNRDDGVVTIKVVRKRSDPLTPATAEDVQG